MRIIEKLLLLVLVSPVRLFVFESDVCSTITSCGSCTKRPSCIWCHQPEACLMRDESSRCQAQFVIDSFVQYEYLRDDELKQAANGKASVQIRPQHVSLLNMKVGQTFNISVEFKQAKDYPVDLYFLMDLSNSMQDDRDNLVKVARNLATTMKRLTSDALVGFGAFVDKKAYPFIYRGQEKTYSFQHVLRLTNDTGRFEVGVSNSKIVQTYDNPEGGFDALVQVMVCKEEIGWRDRARHVIVIATDADSHMAGDGKLAGILDPNDGLCHLDRSGQYSEWAKQDYPSIGQISRLAQDHTKHVIFAVTEDVNPTYRAFHSLIRGSSVGTLAGDSSNILSLVEAEYKAITSTVEMRDDANSEIFGIRYFTSCLGRPGDRLEENNTCSGLGVGSTVRFNFSIEVKHLPRKLPNRRKTIRFQPIGLNESLIVDVQLISDCPCERADVEVCPSRCREMEFCVRCDQQFTFNTERHQDCDSNCTELKIDRADTDKIQATKKSEKSCLMVDENSGCHIDFVYGYDDQGERYARYGTEHTCPPPPPYAEIVFGLMGALVAIGLGLLLVWRLLLYVYDRQQYARFLEEAKNAKWSADNNPLYVEASTTFVNPAFHEKD